jgi:hypothetical protein
MPIVSNLPTSCATNSSASCAKKQNQHVFSRARALNQSVWGPAITIYVIAMDQLAQWEGPSISTPPSAPRVGKKALSSHDQQWTRRQGKPPHVGWWWWMTGRVRVRYWKLPTKLDSPGPLECVASAWLNELSTLGSWEVIGSVGNAQTNICMYIYISGFYNINIYIYIFYYYMIYMAIYIYGYTVVIYIYSGWLLLLVAWDSLSPLQQYRLCLSPNSFRLVFKDTFAANNGKSQFLRGKLTISMALFNSFLYVY